MSAASGRRYDGEVRGRPYSRIDRQHLEQFVNEVIGSVDLCLTFTSFTAASDEAAVVCLSRESALMMANTFVLWRLSLVLV